jgi:hypothetical protein
MFLSYLLQHTKAGPSGKKVKKIIAGKSVLLVHQFKNNSNSLIGKYFFGLNLRFIILHQVEK